MEKPIIWNVYQFRNSNDLFPDNHLFIDCCIKEWRYMFLTALCITCPPGGLKWSIPRLLHTWQRPPAELINSPSQWSIDVWFLTFLVVTLLWLILYYLALIQPRRKNVKRGITPVFFTWLQSCICFLLKQPKSRHLFLVLLGQWFL